MPFIRTENLLLRPVCGDDAPRFLHLCNDIDIARNTARIPHPYSEAAAAGFIERAVAKDEEAGEIVFAICRNDEIVACAGLAPGNANEFELGYWVGADYRRQGIAYEATRAICVFAFGELGAQRITAGYFIDNPPSGRVLEKLGFVKTGAVTKLFSAGRGLEVDTVAMELTRTTFD